MASNDETLDLIKARLGIHHSNLITARNQYSAAMENAEKAKAVIDNLEQRIRNLEGTEAILVSQPPQEVFASE